MQTTTEICTVEICTVEIYTAEVFTYEIDTAEMFTIEICKTETLNATITLLSNRLLSKGPDQLPYGQVLIKFVH